MPASGQREVEHCRLSSCRRLTGSIRSQIDAIWQGGGFNPLSVIEQFTYLLFAKGLNDVHTREDAKAQTLCRPLERRIYRKARTIRGGPARICAGRGSITSRRGQRRGIPGADHRRRSRTRCGGRCRSRWPLCTCRGQCRESGRRNATPRTADQGRRLLCRHLTRRALPVAPRRASRIGSEEKVFHLIGESTATSPTCGSPVRSLPQAHVPSVRPAPQGSQARVTESDGAAASG
jgi:hypothetical protein